MNTENFQLEDYLHKYLTYLKIEKNCSPLTLNCYRAELQKLLVFLSDKIAQISDATIDLIRDYTYGTCEKRKLSPNSAYKLISIYKSYFNYIQENGFMASNPPGQFAFQEKQSLFQMQYRMMISKDFLIV